MEEPYSEISGSQSDWVAQSVPRAATILLVDDDPIFRLIMVARLEKHGYRVFQAEDGGQGLEMLRRLRPDLTILDWIMPKMDGPDVCEWVRRDPELKSSQLFLMTGHGRPEDIEEGLSRGADGLLSKDASAQEVMARVQAGIRSAALVRELACARDAILAREQTLEAELRSAAHFIESLLPSPGVPVPGIQLAWQYRPSLTLGGDLFGVTRWGRDYLGLFLLDASGHGVSAALRAASMVAFLHPDNLIRISESYDPGAILSAANRLFPLSSEGDYFTIWVGALHLPTWHLRFASAGQAGAILCRPHEDSVWLTEGGLALGFDPDAIFTTVEHEIRLGDRLYLSSDGVYESLSAEQVIWGKERLQRVLERHAMRPVDYAIDQCFQASRAWQQAEHFRDDAALVGLERIDEQECGITML